MKNYILAALVAIVLCACLTFILGRSAGRARDPVSPAASAKDDIPAPHPLAGAGASRAGVDASPSSSLASGRPGGSRRAARGSRRRASESDRSDEGEKETLLDVTGPLPRGTSSLFVVTRNPSGEPLGGVVVTVRSGAGHGKVTTDDQGEATFPDIAAGSYKLHVDVDGRQLTSARNLSLAADEERWIELSVDGSSLSIAGRILDPRGVPAPGIAVRASRYLFQKEEDKLVPADQGRQAAVSDADGFYEIADLSEGEYEVHTVATESYPSVRRIVRAGVRSADLTLEGAQWLRVHGKVTTPEGEPLADVFIIPVGQGTRQTRTRSDGAYSLDLSLTAQDRIYSLRFSLAGYRQLRLNLPPEVFDAADHRLDVELEPVGKTATVVGVLTAADNGELLEGVTVYLHSPTLNAQYLAVSDRDGRAVFSGVQVGEGYRLWIQPKNDFRDFTKYPLEIPEKGLEMSIVLDPLGTGSVHGVMVDAEGKPVPLFRIWLRSHQAVGRWLEVTGDANGLFVVETVPVGDLIFDTRSPPRLGAQGVKLAVDEEKEVRLVLDWGDHEIEGEVVDERGVSLPGAQVELRWSHAGKGIMSSSHRLSVTDDAGRFRFTQLGSGPHQLRASFRGHRLHQENVDVGKPRARPVLEVVLKDEG